ncbi:hypothetical protein Sru01_12410 [Sphaerisporangium rufum]|uniref:Uncharacterized protein n=1 Tax=Sphaerisporangium rufum TaxID=1381558 RepID=A0A919UXV9_9ACTN|nr:hypothetical protein [Sphaerisporangium rufum]GII76259.1 hypothetical protein Sru01_12410 [Sphaerisporangium rufum]
MERRNALRFLAGLGTPSAFGVSTEPLRHLLDTSIEHAHRSVTPPPAPPVISEPFTRRSPSRAGSGAPVL